MPFELPNGEQDGDSESYSRSALEQRSQRRRVVPFREVGHAKT